MICMMRTVAPREAGSLLLIIPNRTFLIRLGGISGEFGRAMVRILARRSNNNNNFIYPLFRLN